MPRVLPVPSTARRAVGRYSLANHHHWRQYHDATKHTSARLRANPHFLDWANMPDPFRHYEGATVIDLPPDPAHFLSHLLFHSAAISAAKRVPSTGATYALRVNPSSGNLHPTEFHFIARGLHQWPDGLYHYRPSSHMAEYRGIVDAGAGPPLTFLLTSIAWREAWKYRDRAYRYCLHDIGHAWQSLALAAEAFGCSTFATGQFDDAEVARRFQVHGDEWPMLLVELSGGAIPLGPPAASEPPRAGLANRLSAEIAAHPGIDAIHGATTAVERGVLEPEPTGRGSIALPAPAAPSRTFTETVRGRRSALDFSGGAISVPQLSAILAAATRPLHADFSAARIVQLYLYAHRIDGLEPGVYRHWAGSETLELIRSGDQRVTAAGLSLGQDLAGNACVTFSMVADLERATRAYGDRGYRFAFFEAGAIGQRLYIGAESHGLQATGIGAFFDDAVHQYLEIGPDQGQVIYHFAIGRAVPDPRLEA